MSKYKNNDLETLAAIFKALSNPGRLKIVLKLLSDFSPSECCNVEKEGMKRCCVGELGSDLGLSPSTVSHHLKELRQTGLLKVERKGQKIECWISEDALRVLSEFVADAGRCFPRENEK